MPFAVGQHVFVPNSLVGKTDASAAIGPFSIAEIGAGTRGKHNRSVRVTLNQSQDPEDGWVASSLLHEKIGIGLIRVGDQSSEAALLDPLAKTLSHFFRLLVGDDYFRLAYLRTESELRNYWQANHGIASHLVVLAHGRPDGMRFVGGGKQNNYEQWMSGSEFADVLNLRGSTRPVHVLSLSCSTGYAAFARTVSSAESCRDCAGPFHDVHGAVASQFCQTLFVEHFLHGRLWKTAFHRARVSGPGSATFRLWQDGQLIEGASE